MPSKTPISFKGQVPAGGELIKRYALRKDGTIEKLYNRIYSGPVGLLKIYAKLVRNGETYENIVKPADPGIDYLNGDDDRDEFDVTLPFERGNYIEVVAKNEGTNPYDLNMVITLDYYGGKRRVI